MKTTIPVEHGRVQMIAHRGVSGLETENSCAAFVAAGNRSYFGVETDVWVTGDRHFMLMHDDNAQRVSGVDLTITEATLEEIQKIRLYKFPEREPRSDLVVPMLTDYIRICKQYEKKAVLELKGIMKPEDVLAIVEEIKRLDYLDGTIFISFMWDNLVVIREQYPEQPLQFLTVKCDDELIDRLSEARFDLDIEMGAITKELVDKLHDRGRLVNCWTCDSAERAEELIACGVDFITTNILE